MTIMELRSKRAKAFENAKAFIESHAVDGILSAEDAATYDEMEKDIKKYDEAIGRMERLEDMDSKLSKPTSTPITEKPGTSNDNKKTGCASEEYNKAFWNQTRAKNGTVSYEVRNALQEGVDSEGGYLVPDEFERTLVQSLNEETIIRQHSTVITTESGSRKIPIVTEKGTASWVEEEGIIPDGDDTFGQQQIDAVQGVEDGLAEVQVVGSLQIVVRIVGLIISGVEVESIPETPCRHHRKRLVGTLRRTSDDRHARTNERHRNCRSDGNYPISHEAGRHSCTRSFG